MSADTPSEQDDHVLVSTPRGIVRGRWRAGTTTEAPRSAAFLGIPFAEPPVGDLRFAAPVPKDAWDGVLDALEYGATAQRGDPGDTLIPEPSIPGDSTLNVNVFTPSPEPVGSGQGLPVLVWIHGGGFVMGSPASPWYDGRAFNAAGVVTVTLSYRLGFDGFGTIEGAPSNRGVRDWLLGLEWVQQNIAAFGGDPCQVTIAGQSAGGGAVLTLLGMEGAQHLFHRVYALSSALADVPAERAESLARRMAKRGGVEATRAGFASLSEQRLLQVQQSAGRVRPSDMLDHGLGLGPVVDGELIARPTRESLRAGIGADKPLVLGATDDEFTMLATPQQGKLRWVPRGVLLGQLGVPRRARSGYLAANADVAALGKGRLAGRVISDRVFRTSVLKIAADRGSAPTWLYRFAWPSGRFGFAEHCLDVPFFFDCLDADGIEHLAGPNPPQPLADELHTAAVAFVTGGDPGWSANDERRIVRVWDTPTADIPDAYASVTELL